MRTPNIIAALSGLFKRPTPPAAAKCCDTQRKPCHEGRDCQARAAAITLAHLPQAPQTPPINYAVHCTAFVRDGDQIAPIKESAIVQGHTHADATREALSLLDRTLKHNPGCTITLHIKPRGVSA